MAHVKVPNYCTELSVHLCTAPRTDQRKYPIQQQLCEPDPYWAYGTTGEKVFIGNELLVAQDYLRPEL